MLAAWLLVLLCFFWISRGFWFCFWAGLIQWKDCLRIVFFFFWGGGVDGFVVWFSQGVLHVLFLETQDCPRAAEKTDEASRFGRFLPVM